MTEHGYTTELGFSGRVDPLLSYISEKVEEARRLGDLTDADKTAFDESCELLVRISLGIIERHEFDEEDIDEYFVAIALKERNRDLAPVDQSREHMIRDVPRDSFRRMYYGTQVERYISYYNEMATMFFHLEYPEVEFLMLKLAQGHWNLSSREEEYFKFERMHELSEWDLRRYTGKEVKRERLSGMIMRERMIELLKSFFFRGEEY